VRFQKNCCTSGYPRKPIRSQARKKWTPDFLRRKERKELGANENPAADENPRRTSQSKHDAASKRTTTADDVLPLPSSRAGISIFPSFGFSAIATVSLAQVQSSNSRISTTLPAGLVAVFVGATSSIGETSLKQFAKHARQPRVYFLGRSQQRIRLSLLKARSDLSSDLEF
jgi:hypothetical protein